MIRHSIAISTLLLGMATPVSAFYKPTSQMQTPILKKSALSDVILLQDGTTLEGLFTEIPKISFSFGSLSIEVSDLAALKVLEINDRQKLEIQTREGLHFVCDLPDTRFRIVQYFPFIENPSHSMSQEIPAHKVKQIVFKDRGGRPSFFSRDLYAIEFKNGDRIPAIIREEEVNLSNGWRDFYLDPREIIDVSFDGGLYGTIRNKKGEESELNYAFVKEKFLRIQPAKAAQTFGVPWELIVNIQKETGVLDRSDWAKSQEILTPRPALIPPAKPKPTVTFTPQKKAEPETPGLEQRVAALLEEKAELLQLQSELVTNLESELTRANLLKTSLEKANQHWKERDRHSRYLEDKIRELQTVRNQTLATQDAVGAANEEVGYLKRALETQRLLTKEFEEEVAVLSQTLKQEQSSRIKHQQQLEEYEGKIFDYKKQLSDLCGVVDQQKEEMSTLKTENSHEVLDALQEKVYVLTKENETQKTEQQELERKVVELRAQKEQELDLLQNRYTFQVEALQEKIEQLTKDLVKQEYLAKTGAHHQLELENTRKEKDEAQRRLGLTLVKLQQLEQKFEEGKREIILKDHQLDALTDANQALQQELTEALRGTKNTLLERQEEISLLTNKNAFLEESLKKLEVLLMQKQAELETLSLVQNKLSGELTRKNATFAEQLSQEKSKVVELASKITQTEEMKGENQLLKMQLQKIQEQLFDSRKAFKTLTIENHKLRDDKSVLLQEIKVERENALRQQALVQRLNESLTSQKSALNKIEQSHTTLTQQLEKARNQQSSLMQELSSSSARVAPRTPDRSAVKHGIKDVHIVADGENLNNISMRYYGTPYRWSDIYEANIDVISDVNKIRMGTALVIPE